jgi:hypothetical protein
MFLFLFFHFSYFHDFSKYTLFKAISSGLKENRELAMTLIYEQGYSNSVAAKESSLTVNKVKW